MLAGVKVEGLVCARQIYFVSPMIIASNFDRALIHQISDMSADCLSNTYSATALRMQKCCLFGAVSAVDACPEHYELAVQLLGREQ